LCLPEEPPTADWDLAQWLAVWVRREG
jgi:hypothetical protein